VNKTPVPTTFDDVRRLAKFFNIRQALTETMFNSPAEAESNVFRISYEQLLPYYWHEGPEYSHVNAFCPGSDNGAAFNAMLRELQEHHRRATASDPCDISG
jgi:hypothetical protein